MAFIHFEKSNLSKIDVYWGLEPKLIFNILMYEGHADIGADMIDTGGPGARLGQERDPAQ